MPFSAYDSNAIRVLSGVLAEVLAEARKSSQHFHTDAELAERERAVTRKLIEAYDGGERDRAALKLAGRSALEVYSRWRGREL